jgi:DNA mismatch repair protein MutS2
VIEAIGDSEVDVRVGSLRFREELNNLQLIPDSSTSREKRGRQIEIPKGVSVNLRDRADVGTGEIKLIGQNVSEASDAVDKFLDESFLSGYDRVRIVHGVGMGTLKRAVSEHFPDIHMSRSSTRRHQTRAETALRLSS